MDSANSGAVEAALQTQEARLQEHEKQLSAIHQGLKVISERQGNFQSSIANQVNLLAGQLDLLVKPASPPAMSPAATENTSALDHATLPPTGLRLAAPDKFSGDSGDCRPFLVLCDLLISSTTQLLLFLIRPK